MDSSPSTLDFELSEAAMKISLSGLNRSRPSYSHHNHIYSSSTNPIRVSYKCSFVIHSWMISYLSISMYVVHPQQLTKSLLING